MLSWLLELAKTSSKTFEAISPEGSENQVMAKVTPRHILKLSREEKRKFIDSFDQIYSDCDGVLWTLMDPIKDSGAAVKLLKNEGKKITFVTNNSIRSEKGYLEQFKQAGIETDINNLVHPHKSILLYLKKIEFKGLIYVIGMTRLKTILKEAGFEVIDGPNELIEENFAVLMMKIFEQYPVKAVVIDVDFNLSALKLMKADQFLRKDDCILISGATDMTLPVGKFGTIMGPGPFLKVLEEAAGKKAKVVGKPGKELAELIMQDESIKDSKRVLFIGDMLEQDVKFGRKCGFQTLLTLTGGTTSADLLKATDPELIPDYYVDSLGDFIEFFGSLECKNSL